MMPERSLLLITFCAFLIFSGCAAPLSATFDGNCYNKTLPALLDATDLKILFQDIACELCVNKRAGADCVTQAKDGKATGQFCGNDDPGFQTVMVTDFADIQSFMPNPSGLLMGELMRGGLNDVCSYKIVQAEFAKYFSLFRHVHLL